MVKNIIQQFDDLMINPLPLSLGVFRRYAIATGLTVLALLFGLVMRSFGSTFLVFVIFSPAVTLSALFAGFWPGMYSLVLSTIFVNALLILPSSDFSSVFSSAIIWPNFLFAVEETLVIVAIGILYRNYYKVLKNANSMELLSRQPKIDTLFRQFFDLPFIGMAITDPVTKKWIRFNAHLCEILGYSPEELEQKTWAELTHPGDIEANLMEFERVMKGESQGYRIDKRFVKKDGSIVFVRVDEKCVRKENGSVEYFIKTIEDITERRLAEETIQKNEQILKSTLEILPVGVWIMDEKGKINSGNAAGKRIWAGARYVGVEQFGEYKGWWLNTGKLIGAHEWAAARAIEKGETSIEEEIEIECFDGTHKIILNSAIPIKSGDEKIRGAVIVNQDITARKMAEEKIYNMAFYDTLTQLPNRRLLFDRLETAMAASKRSGRYSALMFLDLDSFKWLNDTHGHDIGDLFLIEVAQRIKDCVREVDTVARLGGDEFVVILSELDADKARAMIQVGGVAEKIRAVLSIPFMLKMGEGDRETRIEHQSGSSIGAVLFMNHKATQEEVLKWADTAMYQAKQAGGNTIRFFEIEAGKQ